MNVVIERSGAQHGYLLIEDKGKLFIQAESHVMEKQAVRTLYQELDASENICKAIVRYVHRIGEKVIFNIACTECMLKGSPDCRDLHLRSILCLPVIKQSKQVGWGGRK